MYLGASWKSPLKLKSALVTGEASRKSKFFVIIANTATTREGATRISTSVFWYKSYITLLILIFLIKSLPNANSAVSVADSRMNGSPLNHTLGAWLSNIMDSGLLSASTRLFVRL
jgi:hypothetical protein